MATLLLLPPVAFVILLAAAWAQGWSFKALGVKPTPSNEGSGKLKAYACGEDVVNNRAQPDYSQFFSFAFFFTVMHVVALIVATIPRGVASASWLAALFVVSGAVGLLVLFRR